MYFHLHGPILGLLDTGNESNTIFETSTHPTAQHHIPEHLIFISIAVINSCLTFWDIHSVFNDGANHSEYTGTVIAYLHTLAQHLAEKNHENPS
jgi:hypothetical protein